ncbi:MAG TPA: hypothetical protein ACHBZA_03865, partial [Arsenophonus apicola]
QTLEATQGAAVSEEADGATRSREYRRRTHLHFGAALYMTITQNRDITARSRTVFSVGEETRRKICVWCLILHPAGSS